MFGKGDLVKVNPSFTRRGGPETVYIIASVRWSGHCLELEIIDPLGDGISERVLEFYAKKLQK